MASRVALGGKCASWRETKIGRRNHHRCIGGSIRNIIVINESSSGMR